jgi:hypothetical protein
MFDAPFLGLTDIRKINICFLFKYPWVFIHRKCIYRSFKQFNAHFLLRASRFCSKKSNNWKADSRSVFKVPHLLWNPTVHYRVHKGPIPGPTLSQLNPVHTLTPTSFRIQFIIIYLVSTPASFKWPLSGLPTNILHYSLVSPTRATWLANSIPLSLFTIITLGAITGRFWRWFCEMVELGHSQMWVLKDNRKLSDTTEFLSCVVDLHPSNGSRFL